MDQIDQINLLNGEQISQNWLRLAEFSFNLRFISKLLCYTQTRKLIANAGVKLNDAPVVDSNYSLSKVDIKDDVIKLSLGKKKHILLKVEG